MKLQNPSNQPPTELTQGFWQAWRQQKGNTARLAHLLLQRSGHLLERFQHFHTILGRLSHPAQQRWQRKLGTSLAGVALTLALSGAPVQAAAISVDGTVCTLADAITAANTDAAAGGCASGSGADTITLLDNVTLTAVNNATSGGNGLPLITSEITIEGAGFTIARNAGAPNFRILRVEASGNLTLHNTTITGGNVVPYQGGGVYNNSGGTLTISNSTISSNSGQNGGGIFSRGMLVINNSTISGNSAGSNSSGGGIHASGTLVMNNSTVSGNSSRFAGGIFGNGILTLSNSTVSGNIANSIGGGIYNFGTLTLAQSLITGNTASSAQEIQNYGDSYASGTINSNNFNLFGHSGQSNAQAFYGFTPSGSDITATSDGTTPTALAAILGPLADNGGETFTHALVTGSPAIDAAPSGPATDQRGVSRPQGTAFDIGAFELEQSALPTATPTNTPETPTATPTFTPTPTNTPEPPTATPTFTPTATNTPTATPTNTPTLTPTVTATPTNTPSPTPTPLAQCTNPILAAVAWLHEYSLITGGNFSTGSDVQNKAFIGGNLTSGNSATFGSQLNQGSFPATNASLEIAGSVANGNPLNINAGSVLVGPSNTVQTLNPTQRRLNNNRYVNLNQGNSGATVSINNTLSSKASTILTNLQQGSLALSQIAANNSVTIPTGQPGPLIFNVTAKDSDGLAIFNVTAAAIFDNNKVQQIQINNTVNASNILINVSGTSVNWTNGNKVGSWLTGSNGRSHTIWNFYQATAINLGSRNFMGTLLAPYATVSFQGQFNGSLGAATVTANAAIQQPLLAGNFCSVIPAAMSDDSAAGIQRVFLPVVTK